MSDRSIAAGILMAWLGIAFASAQAAPLTEAEQQLLSSSIPQEAARELGKNADAAGFARIIATGDPNLVSRFGGGMSESRIQVLPADIEALVVDHFDDPRVGQALRELPPLYRTRALFDRYLAVAQASFRANDPVFGQILRTRQPGIEEAVLKLSPRFHALPGETNPALSYLAWAHKYPGAVAPLLAAIAAGFREDNPYNGALSQVLTYDSPEIWRQAHAEVERLRAEGRVNDKAYARARMELDPLISDPQVSLERRRGSGQRTHFHTRRKELAPMQAQAMALQRNDPPKYVEAQARHLAALEVIAAEIRDLSVDHTVAGEYADLGVYARFRLRDIPLALQFLEKAAKGNNALGQFVLADTYQLELRDKAKAIGAYQHALQTAAGTFPGFAPYAAPGTALNEFWRAWLSAEIAYLRTGKAFRGAVSEPAIGGFWIHMRSWRATTLPALPEWPLINRVIRYQSSGGITYDAHGIASGPTRANWPEVAAIYATASTAQLPARLATLPASRVSMMVAIRHISVLKDPAVMLRELARHDPSGFWTTIALGTVAHHEARGRDGALADGIADAMPGMAAPDKPNALALVAKRFLQSRDVRPVGKK